MILVSLLGSCVCDFFACLEGVSDLSKETFGQRGRNGSLFSVLREDESDKVSDGIFGLPFHHG